MSKLYSKLKGFTLVEIIIVVAIIVFLSTTVLISSVGMREQLEFKNGYNLIEGVVSDARNMALSGESYCDTSDYDNDGIIGEQDKILPNGYIVQVADDGVNVNISLYADLFNSKVGELDAGDKLIKMIDLPESVRLEVNAKSKSGGKISDFPKNNITFMYNTPDATFSVVDKSITSIQIMSLQLKLWQTDKDDTSKIKRTKYIFLHYLYGIPEIFNEDFWKN